MFYTKTKYQAHTSIKKNKARNKVLKSCGTIAEAINKFPNRSVVGISFKYWKVRGGKAVRKIKRIITSNNDLSFVINGIRIGIANDISNIYVSKKEVNIKY